MSPSVLDSFRTEDNVGLADKILRPVYPLAVVLGRTGFQNLSRYRRAYSNHWTVTMARMGLRKYPIDGHLRNGTTVRLTKHRIAQLYSSDRLECHPAEDSVRVRVGDRTFTLLTGWSQGDINGVYVENVYGPLQVRDRVVIDVGASIGDSPIFFVANGAAKVIALEPWPITFQRLNANIAANHLEEQIVPLNVALGPQPGELRLDDRFESQQHAQVKSFDTGTKVPIVPLSELVERYDVHDAVLKLDCEGAEYDAIIGTPRETLRRFRQIQIEYHYGYRNLESCLGQAGFRVRHSRAHRTVNPVIHRSVLWQGNLYADRID
ncbi:MAG: FkbM family methyltransferase [Thermoplasmata archaeon]|nr:FkbM family methyltransferase [Thermoplasmata archaeon]